MADEAIDAKGLKCPVPIARISGAMKKMEAGQTLEVTANDRAFGRDVEAFCRVSGNILESLDENGGVFTAIVKKA